MEFTYSKSIKYSFYSFYYKISLKIGDKIPQWRDFHSSTNLNNRMYIFGGRFDQTGPEQTIENIYDNHLYVFDPQDHTWSSVTVRGDIPCGRRSHSACLLYIKNKIFLIYSFF